ncbi:MAG: dynamin family protein [Planctomycetota bacterium]|nr:dynamin family protein [Planctomycetota bacterium]
MPRTAGAHSHLVVGIVGPNNSGKSALFNALVSSAETSAGAAPRERSPSRPTGGVTRRLVGAAHPTLVELLTSEPTLQSFAMTRIEAGVDPTEDAPPGRADELLLESVETLPRSLLLVDTPDFDSVFVRNREVTDALLTVCDLVVVVVTRHTYQNNDVVQFLREWLARGRPWVLVYNEALDEATTRAHAAKIAADIESPPEAVFHAPFDVAVAEGRAALVPRGLSGDGPWTRVEGPLGPWLRDLGRAEELKGRSLAASLAALEEDLQELRLAALSELAGVAELETSLERFAEPLGRAVAQQAMPMGPFLEAFRDVLDERPTLIQRELRRGLRWTGDRIVEGARSLRGLVGDGEGRSRAGEGVADGTLLDAERSQLERRWIDGCEPALRDLRAKLRGGAFAPSVASTLEARLLGSPDLDGALERAAELLSVDPELLGEYRTACRELIGAELDAGRSEWALQLAVDGLHLLPLGVAGAVIVQTGGLGADLAVAGGGALSAALAQRLSRLLGTGVAARARERWVELRSSRIAVAAREGLAGEELLAIRELADRFSLFLAILDELQRGPRSTGSTETRHG